MPLWFIGHQIWEIKQTKSTYSNPRKSAILSLYAILMKKQTNRNVYIVVQAVDNQRFSVTSERTIPIGAIRFVGISTLKDDWFSLGVSSPQEPDPLINCVFKTEFFTHLKNAISGGLNLKISES